MKNATVVKRKIVCIQLKTKQKWERDYFSVQPTAMLMYPQWCLCVCVCVCVFGERWGQHKPLHVHVIVFSCFVRNRKRGRISEVCTMVHPQQWWCSTTQTNLSLASCLSWYNSVSRSKHARSISKFLWTSVFQLWEEEGGIITSLLSWSTVSQRTGSPVLIVVLLRWSVDKRDHQVS